ncbi:MAG: hypothetical protein K2F93_08730 [Muribaculaceae bacterium]|nr:hypothetical protein [Muribaculaceae bacterium]MDE6058083.1 hypothetical protein [Muribaculaceae bacterium]
MKRHLLCLPLLAALMLTLTSCDDYNYWDPEPPYGWNDTFYDSNLTGCWQLYQVNSDYVRGDEVNYMQFYGDGRGMYFYYDRGYQETERLAYWCQRSVNGASSLQINIDYEYGSPSTMNYWLSDADTLWMQWRNSGGVQTYVYKYYGRTAPW